MFRKRKVPLTAIAVAAAMALAACGGASDEDSSASGSDSIEVFSWWTSGSENAALEALFTESTKETPDLELINAAVSGGAGSNAKQVLATRLAGGDAPETWQTHLGGELSDYVGQNVLRDLTALYTENEWAASVPKEILDGMTFDGKTYAVVTGVHRGNVLWYNKSVLAKAGLEVPDSLTFDEFKSMAEKLKGGDAAPLCLGDKDIWTATTLLEGMLIGEIGADGWNALLDGSMKWSDPAVVAAAGHFSESLAWANKDHKALDWTGAVTALAEGKCAFNLMGDWAYGELTTKHKLADGTDFGYTEIGDHNTFVTVSDAFVVGETSQNPEGAEDFLRAVMSPEGQISFNKLKGSTPVRTDVDVSQLGAYQQGAAATLKDGAKVPSLVQGAALVPAAFSQAFSDAVTLLEADADAAAFGKAMDAAFAANAS